MIAIRYSESQEIFDRLCRDPVIAAHLNKLEQYHQETFAHSLRVALLSLDLGLQNGLDLPWLEILGQAALLHDIGKLQLPVELLSKPDQLNQAEVDLLRDHPRLGFEMLDGYLPAEVPAIVMAHHEFAPDPYPRANGGGHTGQQRPGSRRKRAPSLVELAQILAAADMFDALNNRRAYKDPLSCDETYLMLVSQYLGDPHYLDQVIERCS
jgi:putative nucleotidyltransferase with HDIG domain